MKKNHNFFSNLAFNIAENHLGKTKNNPSVGCVIVKNDTVIGSAATSLGGRPHAEFNALNNKVDYRGSDMYVTLEPCTHYGFTPPCTNIIKEKGIKRVFYNFDDPDQRTFRKSHHVLKKKIFKLSTIKDEFKNFYNCYYLNKIQQLPLVDAKIAISKDFYTINKNSKWITNLRSRKVGHLIRSKYDAIISTSKSINKDNSLLNCRINGLNNSKPDLIIIDRNLKLKKNLKLLKITKIRKTYIFTNKNDDKKISFFKKNNIKIIKIDRLKNKEDFLNLLKKIFKIGNRRVLIETGLVFLNQFFKFKLINNLHVFKSDKKLTKNGYNKISNDFIKKIRLKNKIYVNLKDEQLFKIRLK